MRDIKRAIAASRPLQRLVAAIADVDERSLIKWALSVGVTPRVQREIEEAIVAAWDGKGLLEKFAKLKELRK